jgi:hypothetical protein
MGIETAACANHPTNAGLIFDVFCISLKTGVFYADANGLSGSLLQ